MLFYMLSRGLDRDTAQSLLVYAFLADVLTGMSVPLGAQRDRERADRPTSRLPNAAEIPMNNTAIATNANRFDVHAVRRQFPCCPHGARQAACPTWTAAPPPSGRWP